MHLKFLLKEIYDLKKFDKNKLEITKTYGINETIEEFEYTCKGKEKHKNNIEKNIKICSNFILLINI